MIEIGLGSDRAKLHRTDRADDDAHDASTGLVCRQLRRAGAVGTP